MTSSARSEGVVQRARPYVRAGRVAEPDDDELTRRHDEHDLAPGPRGVVGVLLSTQFTCTRVIR